MFTAKKRTSKSWKAYKNRAIKFFKILNPSFVNDNKLFWKTVKPFFSNKGNSESNIKLVEKDEVLQDDKKIPQELNTLFKNAVS